MYVRREHDFEGVLKKYSQTPAGCQNTPTSKCDKSNNALAIISGKKSNLTDIDYDKKEIFERLYELKKKHNLIPKINNNPKTNRPYYELKWSKVSLAKINYFKDVVDYFFADDDLNFRVLVVLDKSSLDYEKFNHTHDTFYYKMYFSMLKVILNPNKAHHIYIEIKDTRSREKYTN